ncbi:MAG: trimethylamine methyltransferase family protein [Chloroflexi bacterium]|nr:trimethylamine methyltransferase family protein [Chloroflexota bacterium]
MMPTISICLTLALETILAVGPGGGYVDQPHTARYFRREQWQPQLWTRTMLGPWLESGSKLDVDLARERALALMPQNLPESQMPAALEKDVLDLIEKAKKGLRET